MMYDPASLIAELDEYQERAKELFEGNLEIITERHPYGSAFVTEGRVEAPDTITLDTIDDVLPLSLYLHSVAYKLTGIDGSKAIYTYEG